MPELEYRHTRPTNIFALTLKEKPSIVSSITSKHMRLTQTLFGKLPTSKPTESSFQELGVELRKQKISESSSNVLHCPPASNQIHRSPSSHTARSLTPQLKSPFLCLLKRLFSHNNHKFHQDNNNFHQRTRNSKSR